MKQSQYIFPIDRESSLKAQAEFAELHPEINQIKNIEHVIHQMRETALREGMVKDDKLTPISLFGLVKRLLKIKNPGREQPVSKNDLINQEAEIGGRIFEYNPLVEHQFFFFAGSWFFDQSLRSDPQTHTTIRYQVEGEYVTKAVDGHYIGAIDSSELRPFTQAVDAYYQQVSLTMYDWTKADFALAA